MDYAKIFKTLKDYKNSEYVVEYKDEDGDWWELYRDQPIRLLYEREIRIVKRR